LRVFWVGANYEQDRSGLLPSLASFGSVEVFSAREGTYGPVYPTYVPYDRDTAQLNSRALTAQVLAAHRDRPIDVLIGQMWRSLYTADALSTIQGMGIATVNISWDDRLPEMWVRDSGPPLGPVGLVAGTDLILTSSAETCLWYAVENAAAIFWPMASDPSIYRPAEHRTHDLVFVGSRYGIRERVITRLRSEGVSIEVYGPGWPNGSLTTSETAALFGAAKVILGIGTVGHNADVVTLKLRDFDAPMAGALYITHYNPDLALLFREDEEIVFYRNETECGAIIARYLQDTDARIRTAQAGHARALRDHTWSARFDELFQRLGLLA